MLSSSEGERIICSPETNLWVNYDSVIQKHSYPTEKGKLRFQIRNLLIYEHDIKIQFITTISLHAIALCSGWKTVLNHTDCNGLFHPSKVINCFLSPANAKKLKGWRAYKTCITQRKLIYVHHKITQPIHYLYGVSKNNWKEIISHKKKVGKVLTA